MSELRDFKEDKKLREISGSLTVLVYTGKKPHLLGSATLYEGMFIPLPDKEAATLLEDFPDDFEKATNASVLLAKLNKKHDKDRTRFVRKAQFLDDAENDADNTLE